MSHERKPQPTFWLSGPAITEGLTNPTPELRSWKESVLRRGALPGANGAERARAAVFMYRIGDQPQKSRADVARFLGVPAATLKLAEQEVSVKILYEGRDAEGREAMYQMHYTPREQPMVSSKRRRMGKILQFRRRIV